MATKKIENLTPEQTAKLKEYAENWTKIGLCTDAADRPSAEAAIRESYAAAGLVAPERIVWCGSPLSQGVTRAIVMDPKMRASVWDSVRASVGASVWASVGDSVRASVGASVWASVRDSVRASVRDSVGDSVGASVWARARDSVGDSVGASVWDSVRASVGDSVRASVWASVYGQHDANWLAFYAYFREVCGLEAQTEKLAGLTKLARSAGWAIPHQKICWVSERHQLLARNPAGRLHSVSGPAVLYPDGWAIYAVNGTRVPSEWIEKRGELDPLTALNWKNIEQRRAAAELLGWARILEVLEPRVLNKSRNPEIGTLLSVDLPDAPDSRFLKVRCGTGRDFVLPMPQTVNTAREANAWSYGLKPEELKLEART